MKTKIPRNLPEIRFSSERDEKRTAETNSKEGEKKKNGARIRFNG